MDVAGKRNQLADDTRGSVLLVSPFYRPEIGGVTEVADRLLRLLNGAGVNTHLVVTGVGGHDRGIVADIHTPNVWRFQIASYIFQCVSLRSILGMVIRGVPVLWALFCYVRRTNIKTIVQIYPNDNVWPFVILAKLCGLRFIVSLHGNDVWLDAKWSRLYRWLIRISLRQANAITVPAGHLAAKAKEIAGTEALTIHLIPNCVDINKFVPKARVNRAGSPFTILHVSNFSSKKRVVDIIEAFSLLEEADCQLVLIGDGCEGKAAKAYADSLCLKNKLSFCGVRTDIRSYLWDADLFVMASDEESGPIALLEAMACGLPFVSTAWGIAATLPADECGCLVPNRSPQDLAKSIAVLMKDPERRARMGKRGRVLVEASFNESVYLESHLKILS